MFQLAGQAELILLAAS